MAKIKLTENNMGMFLVCEAIGEERKEFMDIKPDTDGCYDLTITLNGKEINVERFLKSLQASYNDSVRRKAADLLYLEYEGMLDSIHSIQGMLEHHDKIFDEKVYGVHK